MLIKVKFRDENGEIRRGELVSPFRIFVEGLEESIAIYADPSEVDVLVSDGETLEIHRIPSLAVIYMQEMVLA